MKNVKKFFTAVILVATTSLTGCNSLIADNSNSAKENNIFFSNYLTVVRGADVAKEAKKACGPLNREAISKLGTLELATCWPALKKQAKPLMESGLAEDDYNDVVIFEANKSQIAEQLFDAAHKREELAKKKAEEAARKARGDEPSLLDQGQEVVEDGWDTVKGWFSSDEEETATK